MPDMSSIRKRVQHLLSLPQRPRTAREREQSTSQNEHPTNVDTFGSTSIAGFAQDHPDLPTSATAEGDVTSTNQRNQSAIMLHTGEAATETPARSQSSHAAASVIEGDEPVATSNETTVNLWHQAYENLRLEERGRLDIFEDISMRWNQRNPPKTSQPNSTGDSAHIINESSESRERSSEKDSILAIRQLVQRSVRKYPETATTWTGIQLALQMLLVWKLS